MQRYFSTIKENNCLVLNINDLYHIKTVMRMNDGEKIEVVYQKELYLCKFESDKGTIIEKCNNVIENKINTTIVIPLLKEQKMDLVLQKATELGVDTIIPLVMDRSIIKLDKDRQHKKIERWQKICKEASEQSKRLDIPTVSEILTLENLKNMDGVKLICSTVEKSKNLKNYLKKCKSYDKIVLVIGPEGGLTKKEEEYLKEIGFMSVSLGQRIMRVETVPLFLLSAINYELME